MILKSKNKDFHLQKVHFSIKHIDINKIVVPKKVSFGKKKDLNISLATKMLKN